MADDVKTGIRLEATGADSFKDMLKEAAAAGDSLDESLSKLSESEGASDKSSKILSDAISGLRQESKTLDAQMKALESSFDDSTSAEERAAQKKELLNQQIETQRGLLLGLNKQLEEITESTGEHSTAAERQREKIYKAQTALNRMESDLRGVEGELNDTTEATEELGEAQEETGEKAATFGDVLRANVAGELIVKGLEKAIDLLEQAGQAMFDASRQAAAYADDTLTLSQTTGLTTEQLQEFDYMAGLVDVSVDAISGSINKLIPKMASARTGSGAAADAFSRLGVRVTNADGSLRDSSEVFFEIIDALGQIQDPTERDAAAMELFGKSARELNPLISTGSEGLKGFAREAHEVGYVLDDETLGKLGALDDSYQRLEATGKMIQNSFGAGMAPAIEEINTKLTELAQELDWEAIGESVGGVLATLAEKAASFLENVDFDAVGTSIENAFAYLEEHGDEIAGTITAIGAAWATWTGVSTLVSNVKELYAWLGRLAEVIGATGGGAAGVAAAAALPLSILGFGAYGAYDAIQQKNAAIAEAVERAAQVEYASLEELQAAEEQLHQQYLAAERAASERDEMETWAALGGIDPEDGYRGAEFEAAAAGAKAAWEYTKSLVQQAEQEGFETLTWQTEEALTEAAQHAGALGEQTAASYAQGVQAASAPQELAETAAESAATVQETAGTMLETIDASAGEIREDFATGLDGMAQAAADEMVAANDAMAQNAAILSSNANVWGQDMMISMANGIRLGANDWLLPSIDEVAAEMAARLHHSEPDVGPLADDNDWMPDMMRTFAQGITDYAPLVQDAIGRAFTLDDYIAPPSAPGGTSVSYGGINVTFEVQPGQDGRALFEEFSDWLRMELVQGGAVFAQ